MSRYPWVNRERAYVQLITKLLGVEFDSIWQRHKRLMRQRIAACNEELLPLLFSLHEKNAEEWKDSYSSQLISQSFYANLLNKFKIGEQKALEALKVDSTKHIAYTNLAASLLLQGKVEEAEKLYKQYKAEFKDVFLQNFSEFERLDVIPEERRKDVERIKAILN